MTHNTRPWRPTAGLVPRTTILRVDQFPMQKIKLEIHTPKPRETTPRVIRPLKAILHQELSLSLARGVITALDANIPSDFTISQSWNGHNIQLDISGDKRAIIDFLVTYPQLSIGPAYLVIGDRSGPCVIIFVEQCVSGIDTHGEGSK